MSIPKTLKWSNEKFIPPLTLLDVAFDEIWAPSVSAPRDFVYQQNSIQQLPLLAEIAMSYHRESMTLLFSLSDSPE
jgi:hypothetical protein